MEGFRLLMVKWIHSLRHQPKESQFIDESPVDSTTEQSWANLLWPLLELILECLPITDYLRFAGVCRSWRDVQHNHRRHHATAPRHKKQMPWLMLPHDQGYPQKLMFYNPSEQRYYEFSFCKWHSQLYLCGSSNGWLLLLNTCNTLLFLVNPFTGSEIQIPIPQIVAYNPKYRPLGILSSVPADHNCRVLLWDDANSSRLYYAISRKMWSSPSEFPAASLGHYTYYVFCGGIFYFATGLSLQDPLLIMDDRRLPVAISQWRFIMESDGKIFRTQITWTEDKKVQRFYVEEWDLLNQNWVTVENLGDRVLFLCRGQSLFMSAKDAGVPGNRICLIWSMNFFDQEDTQNKFCIEYDYGCHQVIKTKLLFSEECVKDHLKDEPTKLLFSKEHLRNEPLCWFAPNLRE